MCICRGSVCWWSLCLSGCPVTGAAKNSSWCTGWESQQQRRKLRPGSQIPSVSAAVLVWPDALAGPMFLSLSGPILSYVLPTVPLRVTRAVTRLLWINTSELVREHSAPGQTGEDVLQYSRPTQIIVIIPFSLHLKTFLQWAGMPSLLSMGAVSRMCTRQLLNLHVSQTL